MQKGLLVTVGWEVGKSNGRRNGVAAKRVHQRFGNSRERTSGKKDGWLSALVPLLFQSYSAVGLLRSSWTNDNEPKNAATLVSSEQPMLGSQIDVL